MKKTFIKLIFPIMLIFSIGIKSQTPQWITWTNQGTLGTSITGTATIGGQTVTMTVTSSTNTGVTGTWNADNNATLASGNNWANWFASLGAIQSNLDTGITSNQFIISRHDERAKPTILTFSANKDIVFKQFNSSDVNCQPWNDGRTFTGYVFSGGTDGGWGDFSSPPTITNTSVTFANGTTYSGASGAGYGWIKRNGKNVLASGSNMTLTFNNWVSSGVNYSNKNNYFALQVCYPPVFSTQPANASTCIGKTLSLTSAASSIDGATITYQWYSNSTASNTGGTAITGATSASYTPPTTTAGTYYYYVVATNYCTDVPSSAVTVTVNSNPTISVTSGSTTLCSGSTVQLSGSGTAATTNPWVSSNTAVATVSSTGLVTAGTTAGTATITYTNSNGCTATQTITVNANPTISVTSGSTTMCTGTTTQLSGTGTAATTNPWVSSNTGVATVSSTGLVTAVAAGTTTITYTNSNGCTVTQTITVNTTPTITGTTTVCNGKTSQLTGSGTPATTNPWTSSNTSIATVSSTGLVTAGNTAGTTTITYTASNGCSVTTTVTVNICCNAGTTSPVIN